MSGGVGCSLSFPGHCHRSLLCIWSLSSLLTPLILTAPQLTLCTSSFQSTDLDFQLRQRDISKLVLCGMTANTCMEATARYAYELGYEVTM